MEFNKTREILGIPVPSSSCTGGSEFSAKKPILAHSNPFSLMNIPEDKRMPPPLSPKRIFEPPQLHQPFLFPHSQPHHGGTSVHRVQRSPDGTADPPGVRNFKDVILKAQRHMGVSNEKCNDGAHQPRNFSREPTPGYCTLDQLEETRNGMLNVHKLSNICCSPRSDRLRQLYDSTESYGRLNACAMQQLRHQHSFHIPAEMTDEIKANHINPFVQDSHYRFPRSHPSQFHAAKHCGTYSRPYPASFSRPETKTPKYSSDKYYEQDYDGQLSNYPGIHFEKNEQAHSTIFPSVSQFLPTPHDSLTLTSTTPSSYPTNGQADAGKRKSFSILYLPQDNSQRSITPVEKADDQDSNSPRVKLPVSSNESASSSFDRLCPRSSESHIETKLPRYVKEIPIIQPIHRRQRFVEVPITQINTKYEPKVLYKTVPHVVYQKFEQEVTRITEESKAEEITYEIEIPKVVEEYHKIPKIEMRERIIPRIKDVEIEEHVIEEVPRTNVVSPIIETQKEYEKVKHVEKLLVVDVPVAAVKKIFRPEPKAVEIVKFTPGPVEYEDYCEEVVVKHSVTEEIQNYVDVPEVQDITVDVEVPLPSEDSPIIDIPVVVPVYYDDVQVIIVPGKTIEVKVEKLYEKIIEKPIEVPQRVLKVAQVRKKVPVDIIKEVPQISFVREEIEDYKIVNIPAPPLIIQPSIQNVVTDLEPIYERREPITIYK